MYPRKSRGWVGEHFFGVQRVLDLIFRDLQLKGTGGRWWERTETSESHWAWTTHFDGLSSLILYKATLWIWYSLKNYPWNLSGIVHVRTGQLMDAEFCACILPIKKSPMHCYRASSFFFSGMAFWEDLVDCWTWTKEGSHPSMQPQKKKSLLWEHWSFLATSPLSWQCQLLRGTG